MVIASSGSGSSISYNRIVSLRSSNSVVTPDSKTYRHTSLMISKRLRGLYIVDKNNIVALIWDSGTKKTDLGTLNLANLSVTYKPTLPIINSMFTAVFVSPSVYFTSSQDPVYFKEYLASVNLGKIHGMIYSSDSSPSSCYSIQTSATIGPFTLTSSSISKRATSIYRPSTMTFNIDTAALTTVDVKLSLLTKFDSWCPRSMPTYSSPSSS
jgi:hypothetical protein